MYKKLALAAAVSLLPERSMMAPPKVVVFVTEVELVLVVLVCIVPPPQAQHMLKGLKSESVLFSRHMA